MTTKHTPEPWFAGNDAKVGILREGFYHTILEGKEVGAIRERIGHEEAVSNSSRAVACVNACAGIADPEATIKAAREALESMLALVQPRGVSWAIQKVEEARRALAALGGAR